MHAQQEVLGGRYELRGVLGRGGMAEVRDAWDRQAVWINIKALKLIRQHGDDPNLQTMLDALRRLSARAAAT